MRGVQSGSGVCVGFKLVVFLLDRCVAFVMSVRRVSGRLPSVQDLFVDVFVNLLVAKTSHIHSNPN